MHTLSERCIDRFVQSGLTPQGNSAIRAVLARGVRLRDSALPEVALAALAVASGQAALWGFFSPLGSSPRAAGVGSFADVWWGLVSLPVAQFLLYRSLWRWAIWSVVLSGLARLDVRPVPVHPDRRGGLAFLAEPAMGFALVAMALDCFVAGAWGARMLSDGLPLQAYVVPFSEIAVAGFVITFGPLCVFSKALWRARFAAMRQYDLLALTYARSFHEKWITHDHTEKLLGSPDIQSMADLANTHAIVRGMRVVPFGATEVVVFLVALAIPMIPLVAAAVPAHELLRRTLKVLLASAPG
jgi:hypothetical protein